APKGAPAAAPPSWMPTPWQPPGPDAPTGKAPPRSPRPWESPAHPFTATCPPAARLQPDAARLAFNFPPLLPRPRSPGTPARTLSHQYVSLVPLSGKGKCDL